MTRIARDGLAVEPAQYSDFKNSWCCPACGMKLDFESTPRDRSSALAEAVCCGRLFEIQLVVAVMCVSEGFGQVTREDESS